MKQVRTRKRKERSQNQGLRNKSRKHILPKPSHILRIHAKGKKQIRKALWGKSKQELCAVGVIIEYYRKAKNVDIKNTLLYHLIKTYNRIRIFSSIRCIAMSQL
jgi:hypothetical protein